VELTQLSQTSLKQLLCLGKTLNSSFFMCAQKTTEERNEIKSCAEVQKTCKISSSDYMHCAFVITRQSNRYIFPLFSFVTLYKHFFLFARFALVSSQKIMAKQFIIIIDGFASLYWREAEKMI
jgi:hypothetical protein